MGCAVLWAPRGSWQLGRRGSAFSWELAPGWAVPEPVPAPVPQDSARTQSPGGAEALPETDERGQEGRTAGRTAR